MARKMKTMDGNEAAAYVSYAFTDVAAIYPITPSSPMAEKVDEWSSNGKLNLFNQRVKVSEMQSEAGAAGAMHGSLQGGALTTTYTASQGLLLMVPNMYKMAGELLPGVFHVSARALATHALSIFGDHQDVMAARQTGFAMLCSCSVQEVIDLGGVAHLAAIKSKIPFLHFFDGFRTSHEIQKVELIEYDEFEKLLDYEAVQEFRSNSLNPERPVLRGTAQNPDIYFQGREASNKFYKEVPDIVSNYMNDITKLTGREYKPFDYYGHDNPENIIIAMGSVCETIEETVDYLVDKGEKVGLIKVRLYRPFCLNHFFKVFPDSVSKIAVLDRTKEPGSVGEPLYLDIKSLFYDKDNAPTIVGGRYGLGSKDTTPEQIVSVYENLKKDNPKHDFTIGIVDDVTNTSLETANTINTTPEGTIRCKFWGLGSDGTVGANKMAIKIIGDKTDRYAQAYFSYDSKKSGGTTISHLRFGTKPIKSTYLISNADFIACHNKSYVNHYDLLKGIVKGGTFVLNCPWDIEELDDKLPASIKRKIANENINFYTIDAVNIAKEIGLGGRINMIMQSAFFKLAKVIDLDEAVNHLKELVVTTYGKKGEHIVKMNHDAIDRGIDSLVKVDVPKEWSEAVDYIDEDDESDLPEFIEEIQVPIAKTEGDNLPVSAFDGIEDGTFPMGTTAYEKRGIAVMLPQWKKDNCIQCNQCSYVCPHAVIRPFLLDKEDQEKAPDSFESKKANGKNFEGYEYRIQVSPLDCTGCGNCADICPAPKKALVMVDAEEETLKEEGNWEFAVHNVSMKDHLMNKYSVKGSQFVQPLLEFSGACGGCGETPYVKLITQLYGTRMMIANATGCSSIWGGSAPSVPYTTTPCGKGPSWANSLFEDNAEFGYGMYLGEKQIRDKMRGIVKTLSSSNLSEEVKNVINKYLSVMDNGDECQDAVKQMVEALENYSDDPLVREVIENQEYLSKKSIWIIGGDGWGYDIGYGGLDHVLASGDDINILVLDTEVYSNTGGQASKATPTASVAKFAASGKEIRKKDLGMMAMSYGYVYVTQIALGANMNHTIKAIKEAESYNGPSLIIAYAPCIAHGIKTGMATTIRREKEAVEAGYWHLYRYNPVLKDEGQNPFTLDSKEPTASFMDFINGEIRYTQLKNTFPEIAKDLFGKAEIYAKERYDNYRRMAEMKF